MTSHGMLGGTNLHEHGSSGYLPGSTSSAATHYHQSQHVETSRSIASATSQTLYRIVEHYVPSRPDTQSNEDNRISERRRILVQRLFDYCHRILFSRLEVTMIPDEMVLADTIKRRLLQRGKSDDEVMKFSTLLQRLKGRGTLTRPWSILHCLLSISDNEARDTSDVRGPATLLPIGLPKLPETKASTTKIRNADGSTQHSKRDNSESADDGRVRRNAEMKEPPCHAHCCHYLDDSSASHGCCHHHACGHHKAQPPQPSKHDIIDQETETQLLRDIIYVFQGIDGQSVKLQESTGAYTFAPDLNVTKPVRDVLHRLTEMGQIYKKITTFIDKSGEKTSAGLFRQSLRSALQREMSDYYRLIAVLQSQIIAEHTAPTARLTLKRLLVWTQEPLQRLRMMRVLVEITTGESGGGLLSAIHEYVNHGDPFVQAFVHHLLKEVTRPFYDMLRHWVFEGELDDLFNEFFVKVDHRAKLDDFWRSKYVFLEDMIPSFLDLATAKKIYSIGKSLNFIRYCCGDAQFVVTQGHKGADTVGFEYGSSAALVKRIDAVYKSTSRRLLDLLFTKFQMMEHLIAVRRYLLLTQGDLVQYLLDGLGSVLSKTASVVYRHSCDAILQSGIRMSNAQYDDPDILKRLDVKLLEASEGDSGWDIFLLNYVVSAPVDTILNARAMRTYLKISHFLWKLKRVEHALSHTWKARLRLAQHLRQTEVYRDLQMSLISWHEMNHFVMQFQYYILFEVLESSWDKLQSIITERKGDLDVLIKAHGEYVEQILSKCMLRDPDNDTVERFRPLKIVNIILRFQKLQERLHKYGTTLIRRSEGGGIDYRERSFDLSHTNIAMDETDDPNYLPKLRYELESVFTGFREELGSLLNYLSAQSDENLRGLSVRLNFNHYYQASQR